MPKLGEIRKGTEIGRRGRDSWIWHACIDCGGERWVQCSQGKARNIRCSKCSKERLVSGRYIVS